MRQVERLKAKRSMCVAHGSQAAGHVAAGLSCRGKALPI